METITRITEWVDVDALPLCSRHAFDFALDRLADGSWLTVPVKVAVGSRPRPRLVAIAGIHGDEPEGMLALLDLWRALDPGTLHGSVVLVPVANPPAFAAHQRRSPLDAVDLNRVFPGRLDGTPSERLAYRLLHEVVAGADLIFTLHSWYATGEVVPYVEYPGGEGAVVARSLEAARAAGFRWLRESTGWPTGSLGRNATNLGIPVIEAEIGGQGASTPEGRAAYLDHLERLLRHLGLRAGSPPPNPSAQRCSSIDLTAPVGGILRLASSAGDRVEADAVLATITSLHGEQLAEMRAPFSGLVAAVRRFASVNPGDQVFRLLRPLAP